MKLKSQCKGYTNIIVIGLSLGQNQQQRWTKNNTSDKAVGFWKQKSQQKNNYVLNITHNPFNTTTAIIIIHILSVCLFLYNGTVFVFPHDPCSYSFENNFTYLSEKRGERKGITKQSNLVQTIKHEFLIKPLGILKTIFVGNKGHNNFTKWSTPPFIRIHNVNCQLL